GQANGYPFVLDVTGKNAVVRNLRIKLPAGNQPRGLSMAAGGKAEDGSIDGEGAGNATGAFLAGGARVSGKIDLPAGNNAAANLLDGATVSDSTIAGSPAVYAHPGAGSATVLRSTLVGHGDSAVDSILGALTLQDDLIDVRDPDAYAGLTTLS